MNILITGGKGFIAESLRQLFLEDKEHSVCVPFRKDLDVCNFNQVKQYLENNNFDIVIHAAVRGGRRYIKEDTLQDFHDNLIGNENILHFKDKVKKIIVFSSGSEFNQDTDIFNVKEGQKNEIIPTNYYAISKYINTKRCLSINNTNILRLFNVFGPLEQTNRFITTALRNYIDKKPIEIWRDIYLDFFYINDLYSIIKDSLEKTFPKELNCCYLEKYKMSEICAIINNLNTYKVPIIIKEATGKNYCGSGLLLDCLNIKMIGLYNGIRQTYESFINAPN